MALARPAAIRLATVLAVLVAVGATAAGEASGDEQAYRARAKAIDDLFRAGQFGQAEKEALALVDFVRQSPTLSTHPETLAESLETVAVCSMLQGEYSQADERFAQAREHWEKACKAPGAPIDLVTFRLARNQSRSAAISRKLGRMEEAESRLLEARRTLAGLPRSPDRARRTAAIAQQLGGLCLELGRYAEAESHIRQALAIAAEAELPVDGPQRANAYQVLGEVCRSQGRLSEAEEHFLQALNIYRECEMPAETLRVYLARSYNSLGLVAFDLWHERGRGRNAEEWRRAEENYGKALEEFNAAARGDHTAAAQTLSNRGRLYRDHGCFHPGTRESWFPKAEADYRRTCEILREHRASSPSARLHALNNLALLYYDWEMYTAARKPLEEAATILEENPLMPLECRYNMVYTRAKVAWARNRRDRALADLEEAMRLAAAQRAQGSGTPYDRAKYFTQLANPFERMVRWQTELAGEDANRAREHVREAYRAMERGRALSLLDQIDLQGLDLLADVPAAEADSLRRQKADARAEITRLESELARAQASSADEQQLLNDLKEQREAYQLVQRRIWDTSPACRRAVGNPREPVPLDELQQWLAENEAVLLEYMLGVDAGYVLVVPAQGRPPRLERLALDDGQAARLGVEQGPLTADRLRKALTDPDKSGVFDRLAHPKSKTPERELFALWQVLVPESVRPALFDSRLKRAIVVPDGPLALLPFEALVVDPYTGPEYLLDRDDAPPLAYAPSATLLVNLAGRASPPTPPGVKPVLSVAKVDYSDHSQRKATELTRGGRLGDLPSAIKESNRVRDTLGEEQVEQLLGPEATEANVRRRAAGRRVLHMACHSLAQQEYGNMFGAAALTIGPHGDDDPADDGYLTLSETYALNLEGCELAILSGCHSAFGPTQRAEGVWAIARGYLVAGAERTVGSAWSLDDTAAVSAVGAFCQFADANRQTGQPDHADALRRAKRWLRSDPNGRGWSHPFYWAPLVLIGPH